MSQFKIGKTVSMLEDMVWAWRTTAALAFIVLSCVTVVFAISRSQAPGRKGPCLTAHSGHHYINAYESKFEVRAALLTLSSCSNSCSLQLSVPFALSISLHNTSGFLPTKIDKILGSTEHQNSPVLYTLVPAENIHNQKQRQKLGFPVEALESDRSG